jgi:hypothetical protein
MTDGQASVELEGDVVVARLSGEPTESLLRTTQERVIGLVRSAGQGRVLYDTLAMTPPPVDVPWSQRSLDETLGPIRLKRAIVVPDSRLAFLARLAFGEGDYRVFYDDRAAALRWLTGTDA